MSRTTINKFTHNLRGNLLGHTYFLIQFKSIVLVLLLLVAVTAAWHNQRPIHCRLIIIDNCTGPHFHPLVPTGLALFRFIVPTVCVCFLCFCIPALYGGQATAIPQPPAKNQFQVIKQRAGTTLCVCLASTCGAERQFPMSIYIILNKLFFHAESPRWPRFHLIIRHKLNVGCVED